jgi:hypothetical protein
MDQFEFLQSLCHKSNMVHQILLLSDFHFPLSIVDIVLS